jgi:hypothetical protein
MTYAQVTAQVQVTHWVRSVDIDFRNLGDLRSHVTLITSSHDPFPEPTIN